MPKSEESDGNTASGGTNVATDLHELVTQYCCNSCSFVLVHHVMFARKQTSFVTDSFHCVTALTWVGDVCSLLWR